MLYSPVFVANHRGAGAQAPANKERGREDVSPPFVHFSYHFAVTERA